jgi:type I site-specific restriction-modification system R (restriction) subunit
MTGRNKFNFIDAKLNIREDRIKFGIGKTQYLWYWAARRKPSELLIEDIKRCYIDDSGASHGLDSMRPHVVIQHSEGEVKLVFEKSNPIFSALSIENSDGVEEFLNKMEEITAKNIVDSDSYEKLEKDQNSRDKLKAENNSKNTVKEYKRTCNECGKIWHSLAKREKKLERSETMSNCQQGINACTCNPAATAQHRKNRQDTTSEIENLKSCPECGSKNYDEEIIEYEE